MRNMGGGFGGATIRARTRGPGWLGIFGLNPYDLPPSYRPSWARQTERDRSRYAAPMSTSHRVRVSPRVALALLCSGLLSTAPESRGEDASPPAPVPAPAPEPVPADGPVVLREALRIAGVGSAARSLVHTDAVESMIVAGEWKPPRSGRE